MVKSRNEPAQMVQVLDIVHALRRDEIAESILPAYAAEVEAKMEAMMPPAAAPAPSKGGKKATTTSDAPATTTAAPMVIDGPHDLAHLVAKNTNDVFQLW